MGRDGRQLHGFIHTGRRQHPDVYADVSGVPHGAGCRRAVLRVHRSRPRRPAPVSRAADGDAMNNVGNVGNVAWTRAALLVAWLASAGCDPGDCATEESFVVDETGTCAS